MAVHVPADQHPRVSGSMRLDSSQMDGYIRDEKYPEYGWVRESYGSAYSSSLYHKIRAFFADAESGLMNLADDVYAGSR